MMGNKKIRWRRWVCHTTTFTKLSAVDTRSPLSFGETNEDMSPSQKATMAFRKAHKAPPVWPAFNKITETVMTRIFQLEFAKTEYI
jgi:hypothetical protein